MTPPTTTTTRTLRVPGARLAYEVLGSGPVLALVGHPMGAGDFHPLAEQLAAERTVLLHDPRGFGASPLDDPDDDADPDVLADDLSRLLREVTDAPADVLGSSGGAVTALALAARSPGQVRTAVAHEPPLISALPDAAAVRAQAERVVALLHEQGPGPAFGAFMALAGFEAPEPAPGAPEPPPPSEEDARAGLRMLAHGLLPICTYAPDVAALRSGAPRVVVAAGAASGEQMPRRAAAALAAALGTPLVDFPGDHAPFVDPARGGDPAGFAERLRAVLAGAA